MDKFFARRYEIKKSVVTVCVAAVLSLVLLTGCAAQGPAPQEAPASSEAVEEEPVQAEEEPAEAAEIPSAEEPENAEEAAQETPFDEYNAAISDYLLSEAGADYEPADASLPVIDIFKIDDEDPEDIKVWGRFWLMNYNLRGTTLMNRSGGEYPGIVHLKKTDDGVAAVSMDVVEDGENYGDSLKEIFDTEELMNAYIMSDGDFRDALVAAVIKYCGETGNEVKAVSEYGWDPYPVSFDEEFFLEYPDLADKWVSEDKQMTMNIADPDGGNVYEITIEEEQDGTAVVYSIYGEYEMSTGNLYYWDFWTGEKDGESDSVNEEGWFAVNEDNTLSWFRGGEETARFSRAE